MMRRTSLLLAGTRFALPVSSPCARSGKATLMESGIPFAVTDAFAPETYGVKSANRQHWLRSVPPSTQDIRPGTEEWAPQRDADHIKFITPGGDVNRRSPLKCI